MSNEALQVIKSLGPLSAKKLAEVLGIEEKAARGRIDRLRASGVPIWHDPERGEFWFGDDQQPGLIAHQRWKRSFLVDRRE